MSRASGTSKRAERRVGERERERREDEQRDPGEPVGLRGDRSHDDIRRASGEVEERPEEDPDEVDEVPVEHAELEGERRVTQALARQHARTSQRARRCR